MVAKWLLQRRSDNGDLTGKILVAWKRGLFNVRDNTTSRDTKVNRAIFEGEIFFIASSSFLKIIEHAL